MVGVRAVEQLQSNVWVGCCRNASMLSVDQSAIQAGLAVALVNDRSTTGFMNAPARRRN